jgi:hypothetical protein
LVLFDLAQNSGNSSRRAVFMWRNRPGCATIGLGVKAVGIKRTPGDEQGQRELADVRQFIASINDQIQTIKIDPSYPGSAERGLRDIEALVDSRAERYKGNALIEKVAAEIKAKYRAAILSKAPEIKPD